MYKEFGSLGANVLLALDDGLVVEGLLVLFDDVFPLLDHVSHSLVHSHHVLVELEFIGLFAEISIS